MQATMCAIIFASVGLAELSIRYHQSVDGSGKLVSVDFNHRALRGVVHLPAEWVLQKGEMVGPTVFVAHVRGTPEHPGRKLICRVQQLPEVIPPEQYLQTTDIFSGNAPLVVEPVTMGGVAGVMLEVSRETVEESQNQWIACCVLPDGKAVTLIMDCPATDDPDTDRQTFHDIVSSIEFHQ
jgi:hypothetical protein